MNQIIKHSPRIFSNQAVKGCVGVCGWRGGGEGGSGADGREGRGERARRRLHIVYSQHKFITKSSCLISQKSDRILKD